MPLRSSCCSRSCRVVVDRRASRSTSSTDCPLQLRLVHRRTPADALALRLLVELILGATARSRVRPQPTTPRRRDVALRQPAGLRRLTGPGALLVHRACGDLLGEALRAALVDQALLDVVVLA